MSPGLSHCETTSLAKKFAPLERVLLTANGNLQRIISSYYNTSVEVHIVHNREEQPGLFHRQASLRLLYVRDGYLCTVGALQQLVCMN